MLWGLLHLVAAVGYSLEDSLNLASGATGEFQSSIPGILRDQYSSKRMAAAGGGRETGQWLGGRDGDSNVGYKFNGSSANGVPFVVDCWRLLH